MLDADTAVERGRAGESVILVGWETTPDDIHRMIQSKGVLTAHGGMTRTPPSSRGDGEAVRRRLRRARDRRGDEDGAARGRELHEGDMITIDGGTGRVVIGEVPLVPPEINEDFETVFDGPTTSGA